MGAVPTSSQQCDEETQTEGVPWSILPPSVLQRGDDGRYLSVNVNEHARACEAERNASGGMSGVHHSIIHHYT